MSLSVSIIIPSHAPGSQFEKCVDAVLNACPAPDQIVVVPEGESHFPWADLEERGVTVLKPSIPARGPAHARNRGAKAATSDILFFVDADVVVNETVVRDVIELFEEHPQYDAAIGSYDDQPGESNFLSQYRNLLHHYVHQRSRIEASTFWGACGAVRRTAFQSVGGFDESYNKPSIEDIELGYRLRREGRRILLSKALQVKHLKKWDASSIIRTDFLQRALPWTTLILRDGSFLNDLNLSTDQRLCVALSFALIAGLFASLFYTSFLLPSLAILAMLVFLNRDLYGFFAQKRGAVFMLGVIPWHILYFLYSGLAFIVGFVRHHVRRSSFFVPSDAPSH